MRLKYGWVLPLALVSAAGVAGELAAAPAAVPTTTEPKPLFVPEPPAPPAPPPVEASIPFANLNGSIQDWQVDGDKGIWIQGNRKKWYYATFFSTCHGLLFENAVGFMPGSTGTLDKWGSLYTPSTGKCQFRSLVASNPPPPKVPRHAEKRSDKKAGQDH